MIALATVMILSETEIQGSPGAIYGAGIGRFLTLLIGKENYLFAVTFGAMAFSTFVFDTLDVATRLGRYILQELTGRTGPVFAAMATALTVGIPALFLCGAKAGGWSSFWVLFGTSNQLLAGLTLLGITVWLKRSGRRYWFTFFPMVFIMVITLWSLSLQIFSGYREFLTLGWQAGIPLANACVAVLLLLLALGVVFEACRAFSLSEIFVHE